MEGDHVQPEEEVLPEGAPADLLLEVLVGGRDHPHVDGHGPRPPYRFELLLLEDAEDLGLRLQGHVPDLIEEQRPPVGQLELAFLGGEGAREGAPGMAEELALDELLGDGRAVDLDEGSGRPQALGVDGPRHQLLAGAVLTEDQHPPVAGGRLGDDASEGAEGGALPYHGVALLDLLLEGAVLRLEAPLAERVLDHEQRLLEGERLLDEVLGAHAHRLDRGLDGAVAGDHDHRHLGIEGADAGQGLEPVHLRQPHVEQQQVVAPALQRLQAGLAALHRLHEVAFVAQDAGQGGPDPALVVHDQDGFAHGHLTRAGPPRSARPAAGCPRPGSPRGAPG